MKKLIYTLILSLTTGQLLAQKWDGSSSTNWSTAANWDNNTVPAAGSTVTIDATVPNQPRLSGNVTIKELKISAGNLNLNGYTLTTSTKIEFIGGTVQNGLIVTNDLKKMENTIFNGPLTITQNGSAKNLVEGNNTFNGVITIVNNSIEEFRMANVNADRFNGDVTFVQKNAAGAFYPASIGQNNFKGNISTLGSVEPVLFGNGGGTVVINGTNVQNLDGPATQAPVFKNLTMNTTKGLILNVPAVISGALTLTDGIIYSSATNLLIMNDNSSTSGAKNTSHVSGPVRKIGNDAFTFPTGKGSLYGPITITAPSAAGDHFTAEYFNTPTPHTLSLLDILTLNHISKEEYWSLNRTNGLSSVAVTLSFNAAERSGTVTNLNDLRVARWNSLLNLSSSHGNGGTTGNTAAGTVKTASAIGSFGDFTIASSSIQNPLQLVMAPSPMGFTNPTAINSVVWKFSNVRKGVDAIITVTGAKNATLDRIDDSGSYKHSWQPFIKYTNTTFSTSDSSYMEFKVSFVKNGMPEVLKSVAMTVIDADGEGRSGGYRELVKVSQPAVSKGILNSLITVANDANWMTLIGTTQLFQNIDTTAYAAMTQVNLTNVSSYTMRVGVLGRISGGSVRQASFAFNNFQSMNVVLPVKLANIEAEYVRNGSHVTWSTTEEDNLNSFDVYRSVDGIEYTKVGNVKAKGYSQVNSNYTFMDLELAATNEMAFYKLKMIDNDGKYTWSSVTKLSRINKVESNVVGSVYPNPTKGELNLNVANADSEFSIEVVDIFGKVILAYNQADLNSNASMTLDVAEFNNGVYFIRVTGAEGNVSLTRFVKN
jgi:hypothetical protein